MVFLFCFFSLIIQNIFFFVFVVNMQSFSKLNIANTLVDDSNLASLIDLMKKMEHFEEMRMVLRRLSSAVLNYRQQVRLACGIAAQLRVFSDLMTLFITLCLDLDIGSPVDLACEHLPPE